MKIKLLIVIIISLIANFSCAQSPKNGLIFICNNEYIIINEKDIDYAEKLSDQGLDFIINLHMNENGIRKISDFTGKLTGKYITIKYNDTVLYDNIPVYSQITTKDISIPIRNRNIAHDIIDKFKKK